MRVGDLYISRARNSRDHDGYKYLLADEDPRDNVTKSYQIIWSSVLRDEWPDCLIKQADFCELELHSLPRSAQLLPRNMSSVPPTSLTFSHQS